GDRSGLICVVWSGRLDIQPLPICITPFPHQENGEDGVIVVD
ncbi:hypothetical protein AVEN_229145-1, partial [Araneus ventricosus]